MAKTFTLINHKNLGPAIVLEKHDYYIDAYFSNKLGTKSLVIDHPSIEKWTLPITDFIKYQLYERIFDSWTKEKASDYIGDSNIQLVDIGDDVINARVKGTKTYNVSISLKNSRITFSCDCPVVGLCKHIYAVCAYIYKKQFYQPRREYNQANNNQKKDNPLTASLSSYLYFQKQYFDFISFYHIFDLLDKSENLENDLEIIHSFYSRSQYQLRVMELLLYPLYLNTNFHAKIDEIAAKTPSNDIKNMIKDLSSFAFTTRFSRVNALPWYNVALKYLNIVYNHDFSSLNNPEIRYGFETDYYVTNLLRYLSLYDISLDEVSSLIKSHTFRNYVYIIKSRVNDELLNKENVKYLFINAMNDSEINDPSIPISLLIHLLEGDDKGKLIPVINTRFKEINDENYPLIGEAICRYMFLSHMDKMRLEEDYLTLADKLPNNEYLIKLIQYQRGRKVKY